jgi:mannitol/fructose-specific phosphotransferase system IIA component (Ntr-type)
MNNSGSNRVMLSTLLKPGAISTRLSSNNRDGVLEELVGLVEEIQDQPAAQATLLHALREREQLHSTGIGDGVAIPHARNALVGLVNDPVMAFGRHETGVPFGAIDGGPTRLFFLLVAPTVTEHLALLARLSRMLREPKLRKSLLTAETSTQVLELIRAAESKM